MSTIYGTIQGREHNTMDVDAYGIAGNVKLVVHQDGKEVSCITITTPEEARRVGALMKLAIEHVWGEDEAE